MLENGVSLSHLGAQGRFPQVSGLCFTYDIALAAGSRITSAVLADSAGNCTATPVDLTAGTTYKIAENDFMASGGDGYPNFSSRVTTQNIMDQVLADYITASSPVSPVVKAFPDGRINCEDGNGGTPPDCPVLTPLRNRRTVGARPWRWAPTHLLNGTSSSANAAPARTSGREASPTPRASARSAGKCAQPHLPRMFRHACPCIPESR
jgi:hypothetical protein